MNPALPISETCSGPGLSDTSRRPSPAEPDADPVTCCAAIRRLTPYADLPCLAVQPIRIQALVADLRARLDATATEPHPESSG